jgi:cytidyltransferase-like protein
VHNGHLQILNEARQRGDVLIVGLNGDASVRSYKGPRRPIVPEPRRAEMPLALRMVDYVHFFDEPDPIAFLTEVNPTCTRTARSTARTVSRARWFAVPAEKSLLPTFSKHCERWERAPR